MRRRIYEIIEVSEDGDSLSKAYDIFMMMCIIASLVPLAFKEQNGVFNVMDWITTIIFVGDYMLRLFTADYKLGKGKVSYIEYPFTAMAIIDLLSVLPSFMIINSGIKLLRVTRLIKTFRVFRVFKSFRYSKILIYLSGYLKGKRIVLQ